MGQATLSVSYEISGSDSKFVVAYHRSSSPIEHVDGLIFMMVHVVFSCLVAWLNFDDVKAQTGQPCQISKRFIGPDGIRVQEMRLLQSIHLFDFRRRYQVLVVHLISPRYEG